MKSVFWQSGQRVIKQILEFFQTGKEENIKERRTDYSDPGIVKDLLDEFNITVGDNNTLLSPSINVETGTAYDDSGERIIIDDDSVSYDPTNSSDTTDDGLGNPVSTPHSTGSKNIPLTVNTNNYVWIDYLQTTDESEFTLQRITQAKQFYKKLDGYQIVITTVDIAPTSNSLKLGNVDLTGFGAVSVSTISEVNRLFSRLSLNRVKIKTPKLDKTDITTSYTPETELFLDDHIKAVGSGTVTVVNPHGIAPEDIGLSSVSVVETHQKFLHTNGIVGDSTSTTTSLYALISAVDPGLDSLIVRPLSVNEEAIVDGLTVVNSDLPGDTTLIFNTGDPSGTWYIFLDKTTKSILKTQVDLISNPDNTKLLLWTVVNANPGDQGAGDTDLSGLVDRRVFGNIATREIQNDAVTPLKVLDTGTFIMGTLSLNNPTPASIVGSTAGGLVVKDGGRAGSTTQVAFTDSSGNIQFGLLADGTLSVAAGSTTNFKIDSAGSVGIKSGARLFLDGTALTGDTYIYETSANRIGIVAGNNTSFQINTTGVSLLATGKLNLDDFGDTYLYESSANVISFVNGGTEGLRLNASRDIGIVATNKIFLDGVTGAGDTYITEATSNEIVLVAGTVTGLRVTTVNVQMPATNRFYLDGGGDTYLVESSANNLDIITGGSEVLRISSNQDVYSVAYTDFSANSVVVGFSSFITKQVWYKKIGKLVWVWFDIAGTSNSTTVTFTVPFAQTTSDPGTVTCCFTYDNGAPTTTGGLVSFVSSSNNVLVGKNMAGGIFTASGAKEVSGQFFYQIT